MEALAPKPTLGPFVVEERYADTLREAMPLMRQHAQEIGLLHLPRPWRPALNLYRDIEVEGRLIWLSVRDPDLHLIGYAMYVLCPSTLFSGQTHAILEWVYVRPDQRSVAILRQLWEEGRKAVRAKGAVSLCRASWARKGGRHPIQVVHWTIFEE